MSVEFVLEDNGQMRVRVDTAGQRAMSDTMDPLEMMHEIAEAAGWDAGVEGNEFVVALPEELSDSGDPESEEPTEPVDPSEEPTEPVDPSEEPTEPVEGQPEEPANGGDMTDDITEPAEEEPQAEPGIDESAPPEEPSA